MPENQFTKDELLSKLGDHSRKARIISVGFTVLSLIALIVILYLTYLANNKLVSLNKEIEQKEQQAKEFAELASLENEKAEGFKTERNDLGNQLQTIERIQESDKTCTEKTKETEKVLSQAGKIVDLSKVKSTPVPVPVNSKDKDLEGVKRVYIQIVDESQRAEAKKVSQTLRSKGVDVPGIELIKSLNGKLAQNQIRYFNKGDKESAHQLAAQLNLSNVRVIFAPYSVENGQMEIWFADK